VKQICCRPPYNKLLSSVYFFKTVHVPIKAIFTPTDMPQNSKKEKTWCGAALTELYNTYSKWDNTARLAIQLYLDDKSTASKDEQKTKIRFNKWVSTPRRWNACLRRYSIRSRHDLDLWPLTLRTFSVMHTHMMNICAKFHPNPCTK